MINFLFLMATATASDIYEVCRLERQKWSDNKQTFITEVVQTYHFGETVQFIFHDNWFEVDKKAKQFVSTSFSVNDICWKEHENSEICFDKEQNTIFWEFHKRNGDVLRDKMKVCMINGVIVR